MSIAGPYPCGTHTDFKIFRAEVKDSLLPHGKVIIDNGYSDENAEEEADAPGHKEYHRAIRGRHKILNGRLKRFQMLCVRFRHDKDLQGLCFAAVANVTQLVLSFDEPLFDIVG